MIIEDVIFIQKNYLYKLPRKKGLNLTEKLFRNRVPFEAICSNFTPKYW